MAVDRERIAREILGSSRYMSLGTANADGAPWVTPVYFASADDVDFFWVSSPDTRHSQNIAVRPEVAMAIYDSGVPLNTGQAVYVEARAEQLSGAEVEHGIGVFSTASQGHGARPWTPADVTGDAALRLYRARASGWWILDPGDGSPEGGTDRRVPVDLGA